jgi:hypothetical protein
MPTSEHEDDEVEKLYGITEEILEDVKGGTNTIIMGEWNSVVRDASYRNIVGPHGLGRKNRRGQMLNNFCERNGLIVTNTWFRKPKRRLCTWKVPGDWSRHQLDLQIIDSESVCRMCRHCLGLIIVANNYRRLEPCRRVWFITRGERKDKRNDWSLLLCMSINPFEKWVIGSHSFIYTYSIICIPHPVKYKAQH